MPNRICTVDGCTNKHRARGWCLEHYTECGQGVCQLEGCGEATQRGMKTCQTHYFRMRRTGSYELLDRTPTLSDHQARFATKVDRRAPTECWPWKGTVLDSGYGQFKVQGERVMAHRFAYEMWVGPIPEGLQIDHVLKRGCVRRDCVNPAHLEPVTAQVNSQRRRSPRRDSYPRRAATQS